MSAVATAKKPVISKTSEHVTKFDEIRKLLKITLDTFKGYKLKSCVSVAVSSSQPSLTFGVKVEAYAPGVCTIKLFTAVNYGFL